MPTKILVLEICIKGFINLNTTLVGFPEHYFKGHILVFLTCSLLRKAFNADYFGFGIFRVPWAKKYVMFYIKCDNIPYIVTQGLDCLFGLGYQGSW